MRAFIALILSSKELYNQLAPRGIYMLLKSTGYNIGAWSCMTISTKSACWCWKIKSSTKSRFIGCFPHNNMDYSEVMRISCNLLKSKRISIDDLCRAGINGYHVAFHAGVLKAFWRAMLKQSNPLYSKSVFQNVPFENLIPKENRVIQYLLARPNSPHGRSLHESYGLQPGTSKYAMRQTDALLFEIVKN
jgi:hypothetical protein